MATRDDLVDTLERIALLLELKGENPFKVRAYRQGAEVIGAYPSDIVALAAANELAGIPGLGEALRQKVHELARTGRQESVETAQLDAEVYNRLLQAYGDAEPQASRAAA